MPNRRVRWLSLLLCAMVAFLTVVAPAVTGHHHTDDQACPECNCLPAGRRSPAAAAFDVKDCSVGKPLGLKEIAGVLSDDLGCSFVSDHLIDLPPERPGVAPPELDVWDPAPDPLASELFPHRTAAASRGPPVCLG